MDDAHLWRSDISSYSDHTQEQQCCYRFQLQKHLLIHSLVQEQLSNLVDHILNHRLI